MARLVPVNQERNTRKGFAPNRLPAWVIAIIALGGGGCDEPPPDSNIRSATLPSDTDEGASGQDSGVPDTADDGNAGTTGGQSSGEPTRMQDLEVIYRIHRHRDASGDLSILSEEGELSSDQRASVARPDATAPELHVETAGAVFHASGEVDRIYDVRKLANPDGLEIASNIPDFDDLPPLLPTLKAALDIAAEDEELDLMLKIGAFDRYDIPILPEPTGVSVLEYEQALNARELAVAVRAASFTAHIQPLLATVAQAGGTVLSEFSSIGWLRVTAPAAAVAELVEHPLVARADLNDLGIEDHSIRVGNIRNRTASDSSTFWNNGYYGQDPDSGVPLHVGIMEQWHVFDESCFFDENSGCQPSRLQKRWECGSSGCTEKTASQYSWGAGTSWHGTMVASILAGDYTQNQAQGFAVCDPAGTSHSTTWERRRSGVAKEVNVSFFDHLGATTQSNQVDAVECSQGLNGCSKLDIVTTSNGWAGGSCDPSSSTALEDAYENAFDDGIFITSSIGNNGSSGTCNVRSPGDTLKIFSVNGIDVTSNDYSAAPIHTSSSGVGGASVESPNGTLRSGVLSLIGLAAPSDGIDNTTTSVGSTGTTGCTTGSPSGTSFATPAVAGMAALLLSRHLDVGDTWATSPGRLHTMMLAMGDRANGTSGSTQTNTKFWLS